MIASLLANLTSNPFLDVTDSLNASKIDESRKLWVLPMSMRIIAHWPLIFSNILLVHEDGFPINAHNLISIASTVTSCFAVVTAVSTSYASIISSRWTLANVLSEFVALLLLTSRLPLLITMITEPFLPSLIYLSWWDHAEKKFRLKLVQPCTALNYPKMEGLLESWEFFKVLLLVKT